MNENNVNVKEYKSWHTDTEGVTGYPASPRACDKAPDPLVKLENGQEEQGVHGWSPPKRKKEKRNKQTKKGAVKITRTYRGERARVWAQTCLCPTPTFQVAWGQAWNSPSQYLHRLVGKVTRGLQATYIQHQAQGLAHNRCFLKKLLSRKELLNKDKLKAQCSKFLMLKFDNTQISLLPPWNGSLSFPLIPFL